MLAAPLAILGAIYTAYFMAPRMRRMVKPSVEVMEALPTVILGFLAGLWLAPFVEDSLPGIFSHADRWCPWASWSAAYLWTPPAGAGAAVGARGLGGRAADTGGPGVWAGARWP